MLSQPSLATRLSRKLGAIALAASAASVLYAQSATAPTASQDPVSIDQTWQKAVSK